LELLGLGSGAMREVPLEGGLAFGVLDPAIAARYRGMEQADSLVLDPHKWLGVPVDAGCALVQRGDDLRDAFSLIPPYLRQDADAAVGTFAEYGLEQTRPVRALETWAAIAARGRAGIAAQVARANALARELATLVERDPSLSWPPRPRPPSSRFARVAAS
jgi:aromatic-L-amino-acid/L-tryptophan decarboxylase